MLQSAFSKKPASIQKWIQSLKRGGGREREREREGEREREREREQKKVTTF
jgi:hypothetical protein